MNAPPEQPATHRKATPVRRKLALLGLAVFSYLVITELGLRIFWHNPYHDESPDHLLVVPIPHPGRHFIYDRSKILKDHTRVQFRVNDRGYILPSHQFDVSDVTIAFLGGSTTECFIVDEPLRFPALVSTLLAKRGLKVNTLNGGRSTNTIHDALNVLINHLIDDRPDIVIFMEAASDHGLLSRAGSYQSRMGAQASFASMMRWPLQKGSSRSFLVGIIRLWATIRVAPEEIQKAVESVPRKKDVLPVEEFERRLRAFVRASRAFGITPVLMTQPYTNVRNNVTPDWADDKYQDIFNETTRKVGGGEDVFVIDLARHFKEDVPGWNKPMVYFYDGIHVTDRGSQEEASYIAQRLSDTILSPKLTSARSAPRH
jgi:lysophospholipase L1-like esterase